MRARFAQRFGAWIAVASLLIAACGAPNDEADETGGAEAPEAEAVEPAEVPDTLDPSSVCGQAHACCEAYAAAVPNVVAEVACAGPYEAAPGADADARCRGMIEGWRETLRLLPDVDPPPACSP